MTFRPVSADHDPLVDVDEPYDDQPEPGWRNVASEERRVQAGRAGVEAARQALDEAKARSQGRTYPEHQTRSSD